MNDVFQKKNAASFQNATNVFKNVDIHVKKSFLFLNSFNISMLTNKTLDKLSDLI